jgi:hypothetical protein
LHPKRQRLEVAAAADTLPLDTDVYPRNIGLGF